MIMLLNILEDGVAIKGAEKPIEVVTDAIL
jgi:hypothetical protein